MKGPTPSKLLVLVILGSLVAMALAGCGPDPKATVTQFYTALQKGEFEKAAALVEGPKPESLEFGALDAEEMAKALFARLKFTLGKDATVSGDVATVQATVTGPDLVRILVQAMSKTMPILFAAVFGSEADQKAAQEKVEAIFLDALSDPEAPMVTGDVTVKLRRVDGKWLIAEGQNPLSFMTDGLEELGQLFMPK